MIQETFKISENEGVCFNPGGRFHDWLFRRHPDGQWVPVRKLESELPQHGARHRRVLPRALARHLRRLHAQPRLGEGIESWAGASGPTRSASSAPRPATRVPARN